MAIVYPTTLDTLTNPIPGDRTDSVTVPHDQQHSNANDAIEALETKVGITNSTVATSHEYQLNRLDAYSVKTGNYTVLPADCTIECDATAGSFTISLPAAPVTGDLYSFPRADTSALYTVTIDGNGKTINGSSSVTLGRNPASLDLRYNGTQWRIV